MTPYEQSVWGWLTSSYGLQVVTLALVVLVALKVWSRKG